MNKKVILEYVFMAIFIVCAGLMLAGMVLGPFNYKTLSVAFSAVAVGVLAAAIVVLLSLWPKKK